MARRRRNRVKAEMNIVPFLDVLLVLLLIFMATAPIISQSVEVNLPEDKHSQSVSNEQIQPVILEVSKTGYRLVVNGNRSEALSHEAVVQEAKRLMSAEKAPTFMVGGDKEVPYDDIMQGIVLLKEAGIKSVGLMTQAE